MQKAMFIDHWIRILSHNGIFSTFELSQESTNALIHLFSILPDMESNSVWIKEKRPTFEEYCHDYPYGDEDDVENTSDDNLLKDYQHDYPFDYMWYQFTFKHEKIVHSDEEYYGVVATTLRDNRYILAINDLNSKSEIDCTEFIQYLIEKIAELTPEIYAEELKTIHYEYRKGNIKRSDYWDIVPEGRNEFRALFKDGELEECRKFLMETPNPKWNEGYPLSKEHTARDYFEACAIGLKACTDPESGKRIRWEDTKEEKERYGGITPREIYSMYADGRENGLVHVPLDDAAAFLEWMDEKGPYYDFNGHHPWEVLASGLSTTGSIHFQAVRDVKYDIKDGKILRKDTSNKIAFVLSGKAFFRIPQTLHFYLALRRAGIDVYLCDDTYFLQVINEEDELSVDQESFYSETVQLPSDDEEKRKQMIGKTKWKEIENFFEKAKEKQKSENKKKKETTNKRK